MQDAGIEGVFGGRGWWARLVGGGSGQGWWAGVVGKVGEPK